MEVKKLVNAAVLTAYIMFILWAAVFSRAPGSHRGVMLIPFSAWGTTEAYHRHFMANFLMLVPVGFLLPGIHPGCKSWKRVVTICFIFSLLLEMVQLLTGTGDFQIDDLWTNTLSGLFGYWLRLLTEKGDK